jgi:hypothetical protein
MSDFASVAGYRVVSASLFVPRAGAPVVDLDLDRAVGLAGSVTVTLGALVLVGTVDVARSGTFALTSKLRVVGGADGWRETVKARAYHNDAGVKRERVLTDLAALVGETLSLPSSLSPSLGAHYLRPAAPASRLLEQLVAPSLWWVGADGVTVVGPRVAQEAGRDVEVLSYDPREKVARLGLDDARMAWPGTVLRKRLDVPLAVRELVVTMKGSSFTATAWCEEAS